MILWTIHLGILPFERLGLSVAIGIVLALATTVAKRAYRCKVAWQEPEGRRCT
jgi:hypothetical protein